tara:strand:- start:78 stop:404 length:327 start_codon:yes stop_codon:yes gene_type:complete
MIYIHRYTTGVFGLETELLIAGSKAEMKAQGKEFVAVVAESLQEEKEIIEYKRMTVGYAQELDESSYEIKHQVYRAMKTPRNKAEMIRLCKWVAYYAETTTNDPSLVI